MEKFSYSPHCNMGTLWFIYLLLLLSITFNVVDNCEIIELKSDNISNNTIAALYKIIKNVFVPKTHVLVISHHSKQPNVRWTMEHLLTLLLPHLHMIKIVLETVGESRKPTHVRKFNLILVDGPEAMEELHPVLLTKEFDINEHYLVVLVQPLEDVDFIQPITGILHYFWRNYLVNISLLYQLSEQQADLYTFFPFLQGRSCHKNTVLRINRYRNGIWKHLNEDHLFPNKILNLHNCSLRLAVWNNPPYIKYNPLAKPQIGLFEGQLMLELAKKLNFSMRYIEPPNNEQRGQRFPNGTLNGAMKMLTERTADISLGCFRHTKERGDVLTASPPYYQTWQIFGLLRSSQLYSSVEILSFAFDNITWICLCLSVQVALLVVFIIHHYSQRSQLARIISGFSRSDVIYINIIGMFFGVSVKNTPHTNFTRFTFVLWFIYGYLMRIAYQSLLFKLLQTDLYREPPAQLSDLVEQDYTLIMSETTNESLYSVPQIHNRLMNMILINSTSEVSSFAMVDQMQGKYVGAAPQDYLTYYVTKNNRKGVFYILPEKIFAQHITMFFTKHSYLTERFNDLLIRLRSQGLIDYWASKVMDVTYFEREKAPVDDVLEPLELVEISGIFFIYIILNFIAVVVFIGEVLWRR